MKKYYFLTRVAIDIKYPYQHYFYIYIGRLNKDFGNKHRKI